MTERPFHICLPPAAKQQGRYSGATLLNTYKKLSNDARSRSQALRQPDAQAMDMKLKVSTAEQERDLHSTKLQGHLGSDSMSTVSVQDFSWKLQQLIDNHLIVTR